MMSNNQYQSTIKMIEEDSPTEQIARDLIWQVFFEFEGNDYSQEGLATFQGFISADNFLQMRKESNFKLWGYFIDEKLVGVIGMKDPVHLTLLFVDKEYHHQGIAKQLLKTVIAYYQQNNTDLTITVNSSLYAVDAYHKMGFTKTDSLKSYQGILFYPMQLNISFTLVEKSI